MRYTWIIAKAPFIPSGAEGSLIDTDLDHLEFIHSIIGEHMSRAKYPMTEHDYRWKSHGFFIRIDYRDNRFHRWRLLIQLRR